MSRDEDRRLYDQKKCIYKGQEVSFSCLTDENFVASELIQCNDRYSLNETESALLTTSRVVDSLTDEKLEAEGLENPFSYYDTVTETVETVKKTRLIGEKKGGLKWFYPCTDIISAAELQDKSLPALEWLIDDFMPVGGAMMLSAKPKMGKSYLANQLALAVASGGKFLGFQARKHAVLYIDFEMGERMLKTRNSMFTDNAPSGLWLVCPSEPHQFGTVGGGFERQVDFLLETHKDVKLVIVDTYRIIQGSRKQNENAYNVEYSEISRLNSWAKNKGITLLLIHHQNKNDDYENPILGISGSTGITAGLQAYYILTKRNYDDEATKLTIGGKEISGRDMFIQPTSDTNRAWIEVEPEDKQSRKATVNTHAITKVIAKRGTGLNEIELTATELAEAVSMTPREVGYWLNRYESELKEYQQITFRKSRRKDGTIYIFSFEL